MLAKRIIPCLDVKNGQVVKGVQFKNHRIIGEIEQLSTFYRNAGADEIVFYDITASSDNKLVDKSWINKVSQILDIPFCVAGGIRSIKDAREILNAGADKISINSPAIENPNLITELASEFGTQCIVVGIDSYQIDNEFFVYQYTGSTDKICNTKKLTIEWIQEVQALGAGEIVLNCMNRDGLKNGYDLAQLAVLRSYVKVPLIASGGAGVMQDFVDVFSKANVDGALAASVFHNQQIEIACLKKFLTEHNIRVRS
jgi:cyclase